MQESTRRYRKEQELMLSALHNIGMRTARQHLRNPPRIEKTSFLSMERNRVCFDPNPPCSYLTFVPQNPYAVQSSIGGRGY